MLTFSALNVCLYYRDIWGKNIFFLLKQFKVLQVCCAGFVGLHNLLSYITNGYDCLNFFFFKY